MHKKIFSGIKVISIISILFLVLFTRCDPMEGSIDEVLGKVMGGTGDGTAANPFKVGNLAALRKVGSGTDGWTLDAHYKLTADITITGDWTPIGGYDPGSGLSDSFAGTFDGDGRTISLGTTAAPLSFSDSHAGLIGLFGGIFGAEVKNLRLTGHIEAESDTGYIHAGAVTAFMWQGTIKNVSSSVMMDITTNNKDSAHNSILGGIAGSLNSTGTIENCYTTGILKANSDDNAYAGGIVGETANGSIIRYCWSSASATAFNLEGGTESSFNAGGIVASGNFVSLNNCVALNEYIKGGEGRSGRIIGYESGASLSNNYAKSNMPVNSATPSSEKTHDGKNGKDVDSGQASTTPGSWWFTPGDPTPNGPEWTDEYRWGGASANEDKPWKWGNTYPILWFENQVNW